MGVDTAHRGGTLDETATTSVEMLFLGISVGSMSWPHDWTSSIARSKSSQHEDANHIRLNHGVAGSSARVDGTTTFQKHARKRSNVLNVESGRKAEEHTQIRQPD